MCEKCGYSGCQHDWQRWDGPAYNRGWSDGYNGRKQQLEETPGYLTGYYDGSLQAEKDNKIGAVTKER